MTTITLTNPWTHVDVARDITGLTQRQLNAYAHLLDYETCEAINSRVDLDTTPEAWLAAWVEIAGPEEAGRVILGS